MDIRPFAYGGVASVFAEICTFPIDTTKTRLQVQGELCRNGCGREFVGGLYRGMLHAMKQIMMKEGVGALYRGLNAAVIRQASYGTLKIGIYQKLKRGLAKRETLLTNICCAVIAGATSSAIANPTDLIKEVSETVSREGLLGLYKAVIPTALRAAILVGVLLPSYDFVKQILTEYQLLEDGVPCHLISSAIAATFGASVCCPVEVVRTRYMNQTVKEGDPNYRNVIHCFKQTVRNEGVRALWKGFIPTWYRIGPWNIIFFLTFEQIKKIDSLLPA